MIFRDEKPIFIIAEVANSHEGSLETAKKLVKAAVEAKADAVKFQKFVTEELLVASHPQFSLFKKLEFKENEWKELFDYAKEAGIIIFADVFDLPSAEFLTSLNVPAYKIHSTDVSNPDLLKYINAQQKPVFLGVGATYPDEIETALSLLNDQVILMHGFQAFPTKIEETNLQFLNTLHDRFKRPVGFMDHLNADDPLATILPLVSIGYGASVIEKHITLDRSQKGIDYESALNPDEFKRFVDQCRKIELAIGSEKLVLSASEEKYRKNMKKSIVARRNIEPGETITKEMLAFKRAFGGLSPMNAGKILGKITANGMKKDDVFI